MEASPLQRLFLQLQQKLSSLGISVLLHVVLLMAVLAAGVSSIQPEKKPVAPKVPVIQAHAVDGQELKARAERKRKEKEAAERKRQQEISRKREQKRKAEEKRRKEKAAKKRAEEKRKKEKLAAEKKRKADALKKKKAEEKRKAAAKKKRAEEKRRKEKALKEKKRKEAEKKKAAEKRRKAEEQRKAKEKKKKAEAARKQREMQMQLDAEMEVEQALMQASRRQQALGRELSQLKFTIRQQIERVWRKPRGTPQGRTCKVRVNLLPGGEVGRVTVLVSSGNEAFDVSVEQAVRQAAPFPYPESVELRNEVRELEMTFVHEG